jgi:hypothetical protein
MHPYRLKLPALSLIGP